jgi:lipoprotein-anchoring transpeptidase ErfK/SrfK
MSRESREPRTRPVAAQAAAGAALGLAVVLVWPAVDSQPRHRVPPASAAATLDVPRPERLGRDRHLSIWSTVHRAGPARSAPRRRARAVAWIGTRTPEGTDNVLLILDRLRDARGRGWVRARLPTVPNGTTGWLPRTAIGGYRFVRTHFVVDLRRLRATLLRNGHRILQAPVGVGRARWPTPPGRYFVRNKLVSYRSSFYGPIAFGTSARSSVLDDWPGGGFVGIHGTDRPDLIPGRISHGCIRMRNHDIVRLGRLMPVGTPITIH